MKKFRELKEAYLSGKIKEQYKVYLLINKFFIFFIISILYFVSAIIFTFHTIIGICFITLSLALYLFLFICNKTFIFAISIEIFDFFFAHYGQVVRKSDWKRIKKKDKEDYKLILGKKGKGHCYAVSWLLASYWLNDAKLLYCSVTCNDGSKTAHAVVVKNNCVYDTNLRRHFDFNEYIEIHKVEIYKIFEEKDYKTKSFFDNIRQDFVNWCKENNVYCDPQ